MVGIDAIVRSLHVYWEGAFDICPTVHSGEQIDVADQTAWVELWIDNWDEQRRREDGPERIGIAVTVHCFSRHATDVGEIQRIVDAARSALSRQLVGIRDYDLSGTPLLGHLRLRETELRDLTRAHDDELRGTLRHIVVLCRGFVEEMLS